MKGTTFVFKSPGSNWWPCGFPTGWPNYDHLYWWYKTGATCLRALGSHAPCPVCVSRSYGFSQDYNTEWYIWRKRINGTFLCVLPHFYQNVKTWTKFITILLLNPRINSFALWKTGTSYEHWNKIWIELWLALFYLLPSNFPCKKFYRFSSPGRFRDVSTFRLCPSIKPHIKLAVYRTTTGWIYILAKTSEKIPILRQHSGFQFCICTNGIIMMDIWVKETITTFTEHLLHASHYNAHFSRTIQHSISTPR